MPRVVPGRRSITVVFTESDYEVIKSLAAKNNTSMNEIVRDYTIQGLNGKLTEDNIDVLAPIIREQLSSILDPAINRLASLTAKTCVQAGAAAYLSAEAISKFVPVELSEEVENSYEAARKKSVHYMRSRADLE